MFFFWYWSVEKKNIDYSKILLGAASNLCSMGLKHLLFVFLISIFLSLYFYYKDKCISSLVKELIQKHKNVSFFQNKIIFNKSLTPDNRSLTDRGKTTIDCLSNVKISVLIDSTRVRTAVVSEVSSTEFVVMESVQFVLTYSLFKTHVDKATSVLYYFLLSNHVNAALLS